MVASRTLQVHLLGRFQLTLDDAPVLGLNQPRLQFLMAYILLHRGAPISRQQLAFAFWPDTSDEQARSNLRTLLHRLLQALPDGPNLLTIDRHTVQWRNSAALRLDVAAFEAALACAQQAEQANDRTAARRWLDDALAAYTGELLPDCYDDWILPIRERLAQAAVRATERLVHFLEEEQAYAAAEDHVQRLLTYDPLDESTYRHLMQLQALRGDRVGVVRTLNACAAVLHRELGEQPSAETRDAYEGALERAAATSQAHFGMPVSPRSVRGNVPQPLTRIIGREAEAERLCQLLSEQRLVTLTGSGGVGKTRLALHLAEVMLPAFNDGAWWVDLEPVADEAFVSQTVSDTLGAGESAGHSMTQTLADYLTHKQLLLVLDNCEHVTGRVAQLARDLLRAAPQVRILVTSQQALGVPGERVWRVPSLPLPTVPAAASSGREGASDKLIALLRGSEEGSVQLFVERAQAVLPSFALNAENAAEVYQICRRLDGIPLAIELAASRVRMLTPHGIADHLDDMLGLLSRHASAGLGRHQTLRATLDWSYALLSQRERLLFGRLAVFAGSFALEAAEAICSGPDILPEHVLDLLASLEDKSLVESTPVNGQVRFRLHEIIRQYATERQTEASEVQRIRARHLDYYTRLVAEIEPRLSGTGQGEWLDRLEVEHDNLRAALSCSLTESGCVEAGMQLAGKLTKFWSTRGHFREGRRWAKALAVAAEACPPTPGRVDVLRAAAYLAYLQGDYADAYPYYEQALHAAQAIDDQPAIARIHRGMGIVAHMQGDHETARHRYGQSLSLSRELADRAGASTCLANLGVIAWHDGDLELARAYLQQCLDLRRDLYDEVGVAYALYILAQVAWSAGRRAEAQALNEESLKINRRLDDKWGIANSLDSQGVIARCLGDPVRARSSFSEGLTLYHDLGSKWGISETLDHLAGLLADEALCRPAAQLMAAAAAIREAINGTIPPVARAEYEQQLAGLRAQLGDEDFRAVWTLGQALTIEQAVRYALEVIAI